MTDQSGMSIFTERGALDAAIAHLQSENKRLRALSQNNAHSWDALVKERDALRTSLTELLADLDDPELIEISAATITRARQALSSGQLPKGVDREPEYLKQRREHPNE